MQIVKGLLFHYTTAHLAEQMTARAGYHDERAKQKESAVPSLKDAIATVKKQAESSENENVAQMTKMSQAYHFRGADELEALENDIKDHKNKAKVFRELAKHLVPEAIYELGESDLRRLEIVK